METTAGHGSIGGGGSSGFLAYVDVFAPATDQVGDNQDGKGGGQDRLSLPESVDSNWEIIGALDRLPTFNLPRLSGISVGGSGADGTREGQGTDGTREGQGAEGRQPGSPETMRLCGYLRKYKQGARSLTKIFKKRWFVFADSTCNLLYYRTSQDLIPLGEINISHATFTFDITSERNTNIFEIRVHKRTYWLEADDRNTMMFWLQELQLRRRLFRCRQANNMSEERVNMKQGLIDFGGINRSNLPEPEPGILNNISMPEKTVGPTSAVSGGSRTTIKDISITNLKVEFRNMVSHMKPHRKLNNNQSHHQSCDDFRDIVIPANSSTKPPSPLMVTKSRFPQLQDRFLSLKNKIVGQKLLPEPDGNSTCAKCKQVQDSLKSYQDEVLLVLEELASAREMLKTAQREIEKLEADRTIYNEMMDKCSEADYLKALREKAVAEVELQSMIHDLSERLIRTENLNRSLNQDLQSLKEDQVLYQDNIGIKDQIVVEMSSRIAELEDAIEKQCVKQDVATNTDLTLVNSTFDIFKEKCEAFELQNKFLNQEILELNQLLQQEEARGDQYQIQLTQAEAQFYELKSKYIYILHDISKPQIGFRDSSNQELVTQLLQDAIGSDKSQTVKNSSDPESSLKQQFPVDPYDQYGFGLQFTIEGDDLDSVAGNFLQRSQLLKARRMNSDMLLAMKWEKFLISLEERAPHRSKELKLLLREGVSPRFRRQVWRMCIDLSVSDVRAMCGSEYYKKLLERANMSTTISAIRHQVELDLLRTLPNNRYYECYDSAGIPLLKNVLLAFSVHNPRVGYCQGLNRLAAVLLLFLDEEDSFWGLVSIIERLMPDQYYDHTLIAAHADQRVLKEIISDKLPNLTNHFAGLGFDVSLFTFNWFLAIFIDNIPVETYLRIWDSFLYEGSKVLFRYTVAILKLCEDTIITKTDSADLHAYMRLLGDNLTDINRISQIAFNGLNPFPMKTITAKRQFHLQKLKVELEELEKLREQFQNSYSSQHKQDDDIISDITSDDESA